MKQTGIVSALLALTGTKCSHCGSMSLTLLRLRTTFFHGDGPPQPGLVFPPSQEPRRKKQRSSRVPSGSSDLTLTQCLHNSLFQQCLDSPVCFAREDQCPLILCEWLGFLRRI